MIKMTKEEFCNLPIGDLFDVNDMGFLTVNGDSYTNRNGDALSLLNLGYEIVKPKPKITQKNLCKFQLKFDGDLPKAIFVHSDFSQEGELAFISESLFIRRACFKAFNMCEITDERWTEENLR